MIISCLLISLKIDIFKKSFRYTIRESNSFDPDQARHFVRPEPSTDCLRRKEVAGKEVTP